MSDLLLASGTRLGDFEAGDSSCVRPIENSLVGQGVTADLGRRRKMIIEQLGEGGFAAVYRARQVRLDRDVTVKVLGPSGFNLAGLYGTGIGVRESKDQARAYRALACTAGYRVACDEEAQ